MPIRGRSEPCSRLRDPPGSASIYNFSMNDKTADREAPRMIAVNRRARHEYFIEEHFEAGLALKGWEVKSLRENRAQITEAYVRVLKGEAWLVGAHFTPASGISTHVHPDPSRT